jgi:tetratricopeptide (TPR) repeat protein
VPDLPLLTSADLDALGHSAAGADDPLAVAAELVRAADEGRIADKADVSHALGLAAEITEQHGTVEAAQALAARAADEETADPGMAHVLNARLLLRLGREDDAMAQFALLRPRLTHDPEVAQAVGDALEEAGRVELAVEWLTEAVEAVHELMRSAESEEEGRRYGVMLYGLVQHRHQLRHVLKLPHDQYDSLAIRLDNAGSKSRSHDDVAAELYWPRAEFDQLIERWPALAEEFGQDWDEHRAAVETDLARYAAGGYPRLVLLTGEVDGLIAFAKSAGEDPAKSGVADDYARGIAAARQVSWPPSRNGPCWCGSGQKYKKCCRPRSRV